MQKLFSCKQLASMSISNEKHCICGPNGSRALPAKANLRKENLPTSLKRAHRISVKNRIHLDHLIQLLHCKYFVRGSFDGRRDNFLHFVTSDLVYLITLIRDFRISFPIKVLRGSGCSIRAILIYYFKAMRTLLQK